MIPKERLLVAMGRSRGWQLFEQMKEARWRGQSEIILHPMLLPMLLRRIQRSQLSLRMSINQDESMTTGQRDVCSCGQTSSPVITSVTTGGTANGQVHSSHERVAKLSLSHGCGTVSSGQFESRIVRWVMCDYVYSSQIVTRSNIQPSVVLY